MHVERCLQSLMLAPPKYVGFSGPDALDIHDQFGDPTAGPNIAEFEVISCGVHSHLILLIRMVV